MRFVPPCWNWKQPGRPRSPLTLRWSARFWSAPVLWRCRSRCGHQSGRGRPQSKTLARSRKFILPVRVALSVVVTISPPNWRPKKFLLFFRKNLAAVANLSAVQINNTNQNTDKGSLMKSKSFLSPLAVALLAASALIADAQSWVNVYDPAHGGIAGSSSDICTDAAGNLYAAGSTLNTPDGSMRAVVLGSGDHGATWQLLDQYAEPGLNYAHNRAVAADSLTGSLLAGGNLNNLLPNGTYEFDTLWFIREWNPNTGVWATVDDYSNLANDVGQASCADILVTPSGDAYATGGSALGAGPGFLVRKRPAGNSAFTTVDADYSRQTAGAGWDLGFHSTYGVFAVGEVNGIWTVRRSLSGNLGTWATVDSFYAQRDWTSGIARCILAAPSKIHVVGSAYKYRQGNHWIVRSSSDGGQTWAITDDYAPSIPAEARGIAQDTSGNLWVCGSSIASAGGYQWVIRKGTPGTKLVKQGKQWVQVETMTWTNIGNPYQLVPGKSAWPNGITIDNNGNIFVGGYADDANGAHHWIVRKLTP